jgi:hypothetical protein
MAEAAQLLVTGGTIAAAKSALWASRLGKLIKGTRAFQALEKGIAKAGAAGGKAKEAIGAAASAVVKSKPFTVLADAQRWAGDVLLLSAATLGDLTLDAINRLRTLSDAALDKLRRMAEPFKRAVLGCASPCKVDLDVIVVFVGEEAAKIGPKLKPLKGVKEIVAALPAEWKDKTVIAKKLAKHPALVKAIEQAGLTADDFAILKKFSTIGDLTDGYNAYRTMIRTLSMLIPTKIGPDIKTLNALAEELVLLEPRWAAAFKGPMFETFAKLHLDRFRGLKFGRATWEKSRYRSLGKRRQCDGFIDTDGQLWDFKHTSAKVPSDQSDDYFRILTKGMESTEGQKAKSVNYLFPDKAGADANADLIKKGFNVFYVTPPDVVTKL